MIADHFRNLAKYCTGTGFEFGEDPAHISQGTQVRTGGQKPWELRADPASQDFIVCIHYLEHFGNPADSFKHWWSLLKDGGRLVIVLPEAGKYPRVGKKGCNPDHRVNFTLAELLSDLAGYGFSFDVVEKGFVEDSFYLVVSKWTDHESGLPVHLRHPRPTSAPSKTPAYSVVIPFYGNPQMTRQCLDSLFAVAKPDEVILIDDGTNGTKRFSDDRVKMLRNNRNSGFPFSVNRGVEAAEHEFVVLLNNDVTMETGGVEKMLAVLKDPAVGMVGQDGGKLDREYRFAHKCHDNPDYIEMFCCAFRKTVWQKVGSLDLDFGRGYGEDSDWGIRVRKAGYRLETVSGCCKHKEGATFGRAPDVMAQIERNRQYLMQKHHRGTCLWVMASLGCNGGSKVVQKLASAMLDAGWQVDVCSFTPWETAASGWEKFGHKTQADVEPYYDVVVSTYHSTMPFAYDQKCKHRFALIQSDEPEWGPDVVAKGNFMLPGFKCVIIADHMKSFKKKYGMDIVGQIANGVDSVTSHPTWTFEREWPRKIMLVRKGSPVWFAGQEYAEEAVRVLAQKYRDFGVVVLGGDRPNWPCKVEHYRTYDEREIRDLYNSVTAMVVPSLIEGCSLVPLEAMASGTPVISTRVGMDYARDGEDYLMVPYKDSKAIVEAVTCLFEDRDTCVRLSKNSLRIAHSRTWEAEQAQWLEIVEGVL